MASQLSYCAYCFQNFVWYLDHTIACAGRGCQQDKWRWARAVNNFAPNLLPSAPPAPAAVLPGPPPGPPAVPAAVVPGPPSGPLAPAQGPTEPPPTKSITAGATSTIQSQARRGYRQQYQGHRRQIGRRAVPAMLLQPLQRCQAMLRCCSPSSCSTDAEFAFSSDGIGHGRSAAVATMDADTASAMHQHSSLRWSRAHLQTPEAATSSVKSSTHWASTGITHDQGHRTKRHLQDGSEQISL